MKFDARDKYETRIDKETRLKSWHRYFAWFPVKVSDTRYIWLEFVYRKGTRWEAFYENEWTWVYSETLPQKKIIVEKCK